MALNPMALLKMKDRLRVFNEEHPRVHPFFHMVREQGLPVGSVLEMKVKLPDGKEHVTNIRLTENDIETIRMISSLKG